MRRFLRPGRALSALALALALAAPSLRAANSAPAPTAPAQPLTIRYYGHAFVYLVSTTGVRIAIDPFNEDSVPYKFPIRLPADVVLVSSEADDHNGSSRLFGSPQVFRSVTAIGMNNARGYRFEGVQTYRDKEQGAKRGTNAAFSFKIDGIRFCHLGAIGHIPDSAQRSEIGPVDVLFLPVGNPDLSVADLNRTARDLGAKVIVPVTYKTPYSGEMILRSRDEYLAAQPPASVKRINGFEFTLSAETLPAEPTVYVVDFPDSNPAPAPAPTPTP